MKIKYTIQLIHDDPTGGFQDHERDKMSATFSTTFTNNTLAGFYCPYILVHTPCSFHSSHPFFTYGPLAIFCLILGI